MRDKAAGLAGEAEGIGATASSPKERLLQAAIDLVAASGGAPVSTRQVTERAGVTAPTLYHHFGDKDGLMEAVVARGFEEFIRSEGSMERSEVPIEDVKRLWDIHVHFGVANAQLYMLMFGNAAPSRRPAVVVEAERLLEDELSRLAAAGQLAVPPVAAARAVLASNIGVTLMLIADATEGAASEPDTAESLVASALSVQTRDAVLRSVLTDPTLVDSPRAGAPAGGDGQPSYVAAAIALNATLQSSHPDQLSGTEMKLFLEWLHRLSTAPAAPAGRPREVDQTG
ncbi:TetR/AcrR family transcriptional regulator [Sinomonas notoginsengisoli]|uniref:TetR/AcrR family transcriptional regulator n=1 Tax=Sinomonas notoginsengisoli TaxID=1457311 RepID=UPI001F4363DE|nr:TetR/AcrR family transcriptional regulator [Sinomonas notoginsengisoli]